MGLVPLLHHMAAERRCQKEGTQGAWAQLGLEVGCGEHWEQNLTCLLLHAALKSSVLYRIHCRSIDCDLVGKCSLVLIEFSNKTFLKSSPLN